MSVGICVDVGVSMYMKIRSVIHELSKPKILFNWDLIERVGTKSTGNTHPVNLPRIPEKYVPQNELFVTRP